MLSRFGWDIGTWLFVKFRASDIILQNLFVQDSLLERDAVNGLSHLPPLSTKLDEEPGHGTFVTCQVAPKREERRGQRKATQQRSWLVLSLVYDEASELSRREDRRLFLSRRAE